MLNVSEHLTFAFEVHMQLITIYLGKIIVSKYLHIMPGINLDLDFTLHIINLLLEARILLMA